MVIENLRMKREETALEGVLILTPDIFSDNRGLFMELFQGERYRDLLYLEEDEHFVQDNF